MKGGTVKAGDSARWTSGGEDWVGVRRLLAGREADEKAGPGAGVGSGAVVVRGGAAPC